MTKNTHWKRLLANNVQERTNREIKRWPRVSRSFLSMTSLERLAGAVIYDQDEPENYVDDVGTVSRFV